MGEASLPWKLELCFFGMSRMKSKVSQQVQPPEILFLRNQQAEEEMLTFQLAVDSYPARASKEPRVSFQQHLCSFFATADDRNYDRSSRH